jgi:hypothetical protein
MATARITGAGMGSIAMLVAVLWACILGEHLIVQRANREYSQAMTEIRQMQKKRVMPVSAPVGRRIARPAIG